MNVSCAERAMYNCNCNCKFDFFKPRQVVIIKCAETFYLNKIYWLALIKANSHREANIPSADRPPCCSSSLGTGQRHQIAIYFSGYRVLSKVSMVKHPRGALKFAWRYRDVKAATAHDRLIGKP